jgi:uncharacterized protein with von Willebrand factor type A (vWA) domain
MDGALAGYVRALRAAGAQASTAEALDAARAMALLGYADRSDLKSGLGLALAKSEADKAIHDRVFDLYFAAPAGTGGLGSGPPEAGGAEQDVSHAPQVTGDPDIDPLLAWAEASRPGASADAAQELHRALGRAAEEAGVDGIRFQSQTAHLAGRMLQHLGVAHLDARLGQLMDATSPVALAEADTLRRARDALQRRARQWVAQRFELYGRPATEAFMTEVAVQRPLGRVAPQDMARMKLAIARMARRLADRHARRQRRKHQGQLDTRRTLRANAGHDGVPFHLFFKHRRRDKPRVVAVCDVSGSVAAQVRFLLLFLVALHDVVGDLRSFAFAHRLQDVSPALENLPFDDAMALILRDVGMGSTDYGQAWSDLRQHHPECVDRRTTLIVLGDGRSNGTDPRLDLFAELAGRARRVIWLCPEVPGRWGSGDSAILEYEPWCTHLTHCATATDLERALDEALQHP